MTLHDVAVLAGVSPMTVSRALNRPELVSDSTVALVRAAVERTGYVPNLLAGGLASSRSRLVAAIVPSMGTLMFSGAVEAFAARLREDGYQVLLGLSDYDRVKEEQFLLAVLGRRPDAVLLTGVNHTRLARQRLRAAGIPVVEAWDLTRRPIDMVIGFSHEAVGTAVATYLLRKGYRRFALAAVTEDRFQLRQRGFLDALRAHGITDVPVSLMAPPSSLQSGRSSLAALLDGGHRPQVVVCSSDPPAQGVLIEAQQRGLRVPHDLAVMGFGDLEFAAHIHPSLSTVRIDPAEIGSRAAAAILARLRGEHPGRVFDVGFEIRERESA